MFTVQRTLDFEAQTFRSCTTLFPQCPQCFHRLVLLNKNFGADFLTVFGLHSAGKELFKRIKLSLNNIERNIHKYIMDRWRNRVAVVTGASSGIGAAIAKDLVKAEFIVVGLARREERVNELRRDLPSQLRDRLHAVRCDVSDVQSVNAAFDWIIQKFGGVDVLVNNAGTHTEGQLLTMDVCKVEETVQTNLMGAVYCIQRAFESMRQRNFDGHIVVVNSILGHGVVAPPPGVLPVLNIYPSTKFGISALVEIIRHELNGFGTNIKITSISPGLVDTDILPEVYRELKKLSPEDISAGVLYAISTAPNVQVHELTIKPMGEFF